MFALHSALQSHYTQHLPTDPSIKFLLTEEMVCQLHALAADKIIDWMPGRFRQEDVFVHDQEGETVYTPPNYLQFGDKFRELRDIFNDSQDREPEYLAALAIWIVNWVHPFVNANGRTSRALGYLILSVSHRVAIPPGSNHFLAQLTHRKLEYVDCLRAADNAYANGNIDVSKMQAFVEELFLEQLQDVK